ncbi:MAG: hypothetical protein H6R15_4253 [Proteobacteria bacterium]|nr:hypothetical protein [Pseudomonadota bacterium]
MKIDSDFSAGLASAAYGVSSSSAADGFAAALKQAADNGGAAAKKTEVPVLSESEQQRQRSEAARVAHAAVAKELQDYLNKTPAEHLRESILKEMGESEESLQAMPPAQRQAAEAEINQRIRERLVGKKEGSADDATVASAADITPAPEARLAMGADLINLRAVIARMQAG